MVNKLSLLAIMLVMALTAFPVTKKKTSKVNPDSVLMEGRKAFFDYDFETAAEKFEEYRDLQEKAKKPFDESLEDMERRLSIATNAFDRVEKIVVIDSISVPRKNFFNSYRLATSAGKLGEGALIKGNLEISDNAFYFVNELGDFILWSEVDGNNSQKIKEGNKLVGDNWLINNIQLSEPGDTTDYVFPFMSSDGQTLYFSNNGEDSMGGYDLFVAQRDPISGEFLQPLNMGMPFNSPYDDLLMAIDEENGLGWWATDRNSQDDLITIYVYLLNDIRRNYSNKTENLVSLARLDDYRQTQVSQEGEPLMVIPSIPKLLEAGDQRIGDFVLPMGDGKEYTYLKDFKNRKAADQMSLYMKKKNELENEEERLKILRKRYHSKDKRIATEIQQLESKVEKLREESKKLLSEVYRIEKSTR